MKDIGDVETDLLIVFYDEIEKILVNETDESIAEMYGEVNCHRIPDKLKNVFAFKEINDTSNLSLEYWMVFSDIVHEIIPKETLQKIHLRKLHKNSEWAYGKTYFYFKRKNRDTPSKIKKKWWKIF